MSLTDPIGDMLTSIRNASRVRKPQVDVPASGFGADLLECLKREGFIQNWRKLLEGNPQGTLRVYLKYTKDRKPILRQLSRISKPGLRVYRRKKEIRKVYSGIGIAILTPPKGVLPDAQARAEGVGGEVICHVW